MGRNIGTWGLLHLDTVPLPLFAPVPATTYIHCFRYHSFYFISVLRNVAIKQRLDSTFKLMGALCCGAVADKTPSTLQYPAITPSYPVLIDCVAFCAFLQYHHSDMERAFGNFCSSTHTHTRAEFVVKPHVTTNFLFYGLEKKVLKSYDLVLWLVGRGRFATSLFLCRSRPLNLRKKIA